MDRNSKPKLTVKVNVDCDELDKALGKAYQLVELLKQADALIDSLGNSKEAQ